MDWWKKWSKPLREEENRTRVPHLHEASPTWHGINHSTPCTHYRPTGTSSLIHAAAEASEWRGHMKEFVSPTSLNTNCNKWERKEAEKMRQREEPVRAAAH